MDVPDSIIEACQKGDQAAFEELIRLTHASVYSLSLRIVGNPEDAAEVTQDVFIKLLRVIKQFRGDAKFSTWLYRVTSNVAITLLRKRNRRNIEVRMEPEDWSLLPASDSSDPAVTAEQRALRVRLEAAIASLPADYRTVVVLKDVYGLGFDEISKQLSIQEGTARVRLFRARQKLRKLLHDDLAAGEGNG
ncbi:MAG TPA: sigma-70 family RNA polymerase sigma factor [Actinomycetota bacterium]|nr:sigma-70 family RNA polymerase sigma factor [Actinomycetota bacterium]